MRAMRDDFFDTVVCECRNILLRQHLKQVLVPQTPGRITSTGLLLSQNGKAHPGDPQNFHDSPGHLHIAIHESTRAPDLEEILSIRVVSQQWHLQALSPSRTCSLGSAPGVSTLLHTAQRRFGSFWHAALFKD